MNVVEVQEQFFEGSLIAIDLLWDLGQTTVTPIEVVYLTDTVQTDTGLEHVGRRWMSEEARAWLGVCLVFFSLKSLRFDPLHTLQLRNRNEGPNRDHIPDQNTDALTTFTYESSGNRLFELRRWREKM